MYMLVQLSHITAPSPELLDTVKFKLDPKPSKLDTPTPKPEKLLPQEQLTPKLLPQPPTLLPSVPSQHQHSHYQHPQQLSPHQQLSTDQPQLMP